MTEKRYHFTKLDDAQYYERMALDLLDQKGKMNYFTINVKLNEISKFFKGVIKGSVKRIGCTVIISK